VAPVGVTFSSNYRVSISAVPLDAGLIEAEVYSQRDVFASAMTFARCEGTIPAPGSAHTHPQRRAARSENSFLSGSLAMSA